MKSIPIFILGIFVGAAFLFSMLGLSAFNSSKEVLVSFTLPVNKVTEVNYISIIKEKADCDAKGGDFSIGNGNFFGEFFYVPVQGKYVISCTKTDYSQKTLFKAQLQ